MTAGSQAAQVDTWAAWDTLAAFVVVNNSGDHQELLAGDLKRFGAVATGVAPAMAAHLLQRISGWPPSRVQAEAVCFSRWLAGQPPVGKSQVDCGHGRSPEVIRAVQEAIGAGALPGTYVTDGRVVVVQEVSGSPEASTEPGVPLPVRVTQAGPSELAQLLAQHTFTFKMTGGGKKQAFTPEEFTPPGPALTAALAAGSWPGLRPLHGIIGGPVLRPDGTMLQEPGYDERTGLYLASRHKIFPVPVPVPPQALDWARDLIFRQVTGDFPWAGPADKANYLAMLFTPALRRYLRGAPVPFFIVSAPGQGQGKTLLVTIPGLLYGQLQLVWTGDDAELRKALTAVLMDQGGVVSFDNVPEGAVIRSPVLAELLTSRVWGDRLLGGNVLAKLANDRVWAATGNNLRLGGDLGTRSVPIRIDARMPHPEQRSGFAIPSLDTWIEEPPSQQNLECAIRVLLTSWAAAGCPAAEVVPMRQFTAWARAVGGLLAHHGVDGFLANAAENEAMDDDNADWAQFLACWSAIFGGAWKSSAAVHREGWRDDWGGSFPARRDGGLSVKSLGRLLAAQKDRYHGWYRLEGRQDLHTGMWWWRVQRV